MRPSALLTASLLTCLLTSSVVAEAKPWVVYPGGKGPGAGKHIVFVTGDDEYRSEEGMPMLAKILSVRHGFKCTVLFAVDPKTGVIKPDHQTNIPGLEALDSADLMVLFLRFRELPDQQMKHIVDFTHSGKPIIGLRTSTHAFNYSRDKTSKFRPLTFNSGKPRGGWGGLVLGDTWLNHHGHRAAHHGAHLGHEIARLLEIKTDTTGIAARQLFPAIVNGRRIPTFQFEHLLVIDHERASFGCVESGCCV